MAEYVQEHIEELLPDLETVRHLDLFSEEEVKNVVRKHKSLEYALRRREKGKAEYLTFIQYEVNFLALLMRRAQRAGVVSVSACRQVERRVWHRIDSLFHMVCTRYGQDLTLWSSYIEFLEQTHAGRQLISRKYNKLLGFHSNNEDVWLAAVKWEVVHMEQIENARLLLQRALRFLPRSTRIWLQTFTIEMLNAANLKENSELNEQIRDGVDKGSDEAVASGEAAMIIFREAMKVETNNPVEFCLSFGIYAEEFEELPVVKKCIWDYVDQHYSNNKLIWDFKAKNKLKQLLTYHGCGMEEMIKMVESECDSTYMEGINLCKDKVGLLYLYIDFCCSRYELHSGVSNTLKEVWVDRAFNGYQLLYDNVKDNMDINYIVKWFELMETSRCDDTVRRQDEDILENLLTKNRTNEYLWYHKLRLEIRKCGASVKELKRLTKTFADCRKALSGMESVRIWKLILTWFDKVDKSEGGGFVEKLLPQLMVTCSKELIPIKILFLDWAYSVGGVKKTKEVYHLLKSSVPINLLFFQHILSLVEDDETKDESDILWKRSVYEDAVSKLGARSVDIWLEYINFEQEEGEPAQIGHIYWRATKTLKKHILEKFTSRYILSSQK